MKRRFIILIITMALVIGCATAKKSTYVVPDDIKNRGIRIVKDVVVCIKPPPKTGLYVYPSKSPNALFDGQNVLFSEGIFDYDDDTLKFVLAHEIAHINLGHVNKRKAASYSITGVMMIVGAIIPGAGLLNHAINPAVVNNYSKSQELDADKLASETCLKCLNIPISKQVEIMTALKKVSDAGGFWDQHPSWDERIRNIKAIKP